MNGGRMARKRMLEVRITEEQVELYKEAAGAGRMSVSQLVRHAADYYSEQLLDRVRAKASQPAPEPVVEEAPAPTPAPVTVQRPAPTTIKGRDTGKLWLNMPIIEDAEGLFFFITSDNTRGKLPDEVIARMRKR